MKCASDHQSIKLLTPFQTVGAFIKFRISTKWAHVDKLGLSSSIFLPQPQDPVPHILPRLLLESIANLLSSPVVQHTSSWTTFYLPFRSLLYLESGYRSRSNLVALRDISVFLPCISIRESHCCFIRQ